MSEIASLPKIQIKTNNESPEYIFNEELKFWDIDVKIDRNGNQTTTIHFNYLKAYQFLQSNKFFRLEKLVGDYIFIHIEKNIVNQVKPYQIKDFVINFLKQKSLGIYHDEVLNMVFRGGSRYLGPESLSHIEFTELDFLRDEKKCKYMFFQENVWKITSESIEEIDYSQLKGFVWRDKIIEYQPKLTENIYFDIKKSKSGFNFEKKPGFEKSNWLKFLYNTSRIHWRNEANISKVDIENDTNLNLINKLSAIGYLLHRYRDDSRTWAVIAMDNEESPVGESNGGTGKSIIGFGIEEIVQTVYIEGKSKKLTEDPHLFGNVDEKTDLIFLDDVRINVDFEFFYPVITGKLTVNPKGTQRFTIPKNQTPKLYIPTNHAIRGSGNSDERRQFKMAFSDYYNRDRTPESEFKEVFFSDEWSDTQKNHFYNVMARAVQIWLKYGKVDPPIFNLEKRKLRQEIGEPFIEWATVFLEFSELIDKGNEFIKEFGKKDENGKKQFIEFWRYSAWNDFQQSLSMNQRKFYSSNNFRYKLLNYCTYVSSYKAKWILDKKEGGNNGRFSTYNPRTGKTEEYFRIVIEIAKDDS